MNAVQCFLPLHEQRHTGTANRFRELTDEQMRLRPHPQINSIAWLLWHIARREDIGVNRLTANRPDVLTGDGWASRLNLSRRDMGTGMSDEEVAEFSARVNTVALRAHSAAVGRRTQEVVQGLPAEALDDVPDPSHIRQVLVEEGAMGPNAAWLEPSTSGNPRDGCSSSWRSGIPVDSRSSHADQEAARLGQRWPLNPPPSARLVMSVSQGHDGAGMHGATWYEWPRASGTPIQHHFMRSREFLGAIW